MTSRERVIRAIEYREPDHVPFAEHFWEDTLERWYGEGLVRNTILHEHFDFDIIEMGIDASPRFEVEVLHEEDEYRTIRDRFGYVAKMYRGKSRTLDYLSCAVSDKEQWPAVKDMFVIGDTGPARADDVAFPFRTSPVPSWDEVREKYRGLRSREKYILGSVYGPHEATWRFRGFTDTLMDLVLDPDFIVEIASTYTDFLLQVVGRCLDEGIRFDGLFLVEDLAGTRGMIFSPDLWRKIYKPMIKQIGIFLEKRGLHFWMHSCGNCEEIFPDLIECGLRVINPLEVKSGLDVLGLREKYGTHLAFYGNIDVRALGQSEAETEREINRKIAAFSSEGGYIFHSDHSIPPEVGYDRYLFAIDCLRRYGKYR
ncbi:uroporphyrinogen decarboxylase family protein [Candidatus Latescibacterota bacterium]